MHDIPTGRTFRTAIDAVLPSVVFVQVEISPAGLFPLPPGGGTPTPVEPVPIGAGSGVVIAADGRILTNAHMVSRADRVALTLYDGRQTEARVVALDPATDIAVLDAEADDLPAAPLGRSSDLAVGQWVLAVGSPLGLSFSATAGIVSATGRAIGVLARAAAGERTPPLEHFIQTDAAINPGNSGGPLIDVDGRVVGVTSAIASQSGAFSGVGFAIPIDLARRIAHDLMRHGEVRRPFIGALLAEVDDADVALYELPAAEGAEIVHLAEDGPAERAGVELGDVIVELDGDPVRSVGDFRAALIAREPDDEVTLSLIRYGRTIEVPVRLGVMRTGGRPEPPPPLEGERAAELGFAVGLADGRPAVAAVRPFSRAARAGVRPGQVIVSANRREVRSVDDLAAAIGDSKHDVLSLIVVDPEVGRTILNYRLKR